jgi:hypothetical protein
MKLFVSLNTYFSGKPEEPKFNDNFEESIALINNGFCVNFLLLQKFQLGEHLTFAMSIFTYGQKGSKLR